MRIYLPSTVARLRIAEADGVVRPVSGIGFGVTSALRQEYPTADEEELEYLAMADAARASLRLLGGEAGEDPVPMARVVIAADAESVTEYPDGDRAAVRLADDVVWRQVAAVHLDGADAAEAVRAAVGVVDAADLGDPDAEFLVGEAEAHELAWYAPQEISFLLREL